MLTFVNLSLDRCHHCVKALIASFRMANVDNYDTHRTNIFSGKNFFSRDGKNRSESWLPEQNETAKNLRNKTWHLAARGIDNKTTNPISIPASWTVIGYHCSKVGSYTFRYRRKEVRSMREVIHIPEFVDEQPK